MKVKIVRVSDCAEYEFLPDADKDIAIETALAWFNERDRDRCVRICRRTRGRNSGQCLRTVKDKG